MIPALGPQKKILGSLVTLAQVPWRRAERRSTEMPAEARAKCAAATEHDQQALRPLHHTMQSIVTEFNASPTDDARDLVNAAQVMLIGERQDVRNLCKPWGVHLAAQKSIAP